MKLGITIKLIAISEIKMCSLSECVILNVISLFANQIEISYSFDDILSISFML